MEKAPRKPATKVSFPRSKLPERLAALPNEKLVALMLRLLERYGEEDEM